MAGDKGTEVSLFPFLDILSGVIGTFALIIVGMAIISIEGTPQLVRTAGGTERQRRPSFVEARQDGMLIHIISEQGEHRAVPVPLEQIKQPAGAWKERLQMLEQNPQQFYLLILVRPNGLESYERIRQVAARHRLKVGYDAIYEAGDVKFDLDSVKPKENTAEDAESSDAPDGPVTAEEVSR